MEDTMSPELHKRLTSHLLSERLMLEQIIDETLDGQSSDCFIIQHNECEQLLLQIEKESNGTTPDQRPQAPAEAAGGNGQ
jgi:hypothetical protein